MTSIAPQEPLLNKHHTKFLHESCTWWHKQDWKQAYDLQAITLKIKDRKTKSKSHLIQCFLTNLGGIGKFYTVGILTVNFLYKQWTSFPTQCKRNISRVKKKKYHNFRVQRLENLVKAWELRWNIHGTVLL